MRYCILLLALLSSPLYSQTNPASGSSAPWESDLFDMEFSVSGRANFRYVGSSYESLIGLKTDTYKIRKEMLSKFRQRKFNESDLRTSLRFVSGLDGLAVGRDDGILAETHTEFTASLRNMFLPRDAVRLGISTRTFGATTSVLELESLLEFRLVDQDRTSWFGDLKQAVQIIGIKGPTSHNAVKLSELLRAAGYEPPVADTLAEIATEEGVDASGYSGQLFVHLMANTALGIGDALAEGANPVKRNRSIAHTHVVWMRNFDLDYSVGLTDWVTLGVRGTLIQAGLVGKRDYLRSYHGSDFGGYFLKGVERAHTADSTKMSFGISAGLFLNIPQPIFPRLSIGFWGENINAPSLHWREGDLHIPAKYRASVSWNVFGETIPLRVWYEMDLNRTENLALNNYHEQYVSFGLELDPDYPVAGPTANFGVTKNVGDTHEPWLLSLELGVKLWDFRFYVGGETNLSIADIPGLNVPERFSLWARAELTVTFGS